METVINHSFVDEVTSRFQALVKIVPLSAIRTQKQYKNTVALLNQLLDAGAADQKSPLADLVNSLGSLIGDYEDTHLAKVEVSPLETLRFLMEQHNLTQSDLPEIGTQGVVSEILCGKRELNVRQIKELARRFHVSASVFI